VPREPVSRGHPAKRCESGLWTMVRDRFAFKREPLLGRAAEAGPAATHARADWPRRADAAVSDARETLFCGEPRLSPQSAQDELGLTRPVTIARSPGQRRRSSLRKLTGRLHSVTNAFTPNRRAYPW